jgi:hypothetical protein
MTDIRFHDISYAQGLYNMDADNAPIIFLRMSYYGYGDKTGHYDSQAAHNYQNAIRTGKLPGMYHFAGGGDPKQEAEFFVGACSPLADGDLLILDYELTASMSPPADPNAWCLTFVERVRELTGKYPLFYTYHALQQQYGFSEVLKRCGYWVAHYGIAPEADIPNAPPYIIHQYQGAPLDTNACFIPVETLRRYAYDGVIPQPAPPTHDPTPPVVIINDPLPPKPIPEPTPTPDPTPTPLPEPTPPPTQPDWKHLVAVLVAAVAAIIAAIGAWIK